MLQRECSGDRREVNVMITAAPLHHNGFCECSACLEVYFAHGWGPVACRSCDFELISSPSIRLTGTNWDRRQPYSFNHSYSLSGTDPVLLGTSGTCSIDFNGSRIEQAGSETTTMSWDLSICYLMAASLQFTTDLARQH